MVSKPAPGSIAIQLIKGAGGASTFGRTSFAKGFIDTEWGRGQGGD